MGWAALYWKSLGCGLNQVSPYRATGNDPLYFALENILSVYFFAEKPMSVCVCVCVCDDVRYQQYTQTCGYLRLNVVVGYVGKMEDNAGFQIGRQKEYEWSAETA